MENKIKIMEKVLPAIFILSMIAWVITIYGLFSMMAGIMAFIGIIILLARKKNPGDERDWQIAYASTYGSFFITISLLFVYQIFEFVKNGKENPLAAVVICILVFSQGILNMIFRKTGK